MTVAGATVTQMVEWRRQHAALVSTGFEELPFQHFETSHLPEPEPAPLAG